jgi:autotransporter-associated beta strand protein
VFAGTTQTTTNDDFAAGTSFSSITFGSAGFNLTGNQVSLSGGITVASGVSTASVTLPISMSAAQSLTVPSGGSLMIAGAISGSGAMTTSGAGMLILSATDTNTGTLTVAAGTVQIGNGGSTGSVSSAITLAGGALEYDWNVFESPTANITLTASSSLGTIGQQVNLGGTLNGGSYQLNINGVSAQPIYLNNTCSNISQVNILAGSSLGVDFHTGNQLGTSYPLINVGSGATFQTYNGGPFYNQITLNGGNGNDGTGEILNAGGGVATFRNTITLAGGVSSIGTNGANINITGNVTGSGGLGILGTAVVTLSGNNGYSGGTTVTSGTLQAGNGGSTGTIPANITLAGGTLQYDLNAFATPSLNINLTANSTIGTIGQQVNVGGTLSGGGCQLSVNDGTSTLPLYLNDTVSNVSQFNVVAGALGFDYLWGNQGGTNTPPIVVASGATFETYDNGTLANNITLNSGTGVAGLGELANRGNGNSSFTGQINLPGGIAAIGTAYGNIILNAAITGVGGINKIGTNTLTLAGSSSYTGGTNVSAGVLAVSNTSGSATGTGAVRVANGATLEGNGSAGAAVTVYSGGILIPGVGGTAIFNTGNISLASGSNFNVVLNSSSPGSGYGQLNVTGMVNLNGSYLNLSGSRTNHDGDQITIINNDGTDAVVGIFNNLPEGSHLVVNGVTYFLSYHGGTGNDVVLTDATPPRAANDNYNAIENVALAQNASHGVLANDTSYNGGTLSVYSVDGSTSNVNQTITSSHGTLTLYADGSFTYVPQHDFVGVDDATFYVATDGVEMSNSATVQFVTGPGALYATATSISAIQGQSTGSITVAHFTDQSGGEVGNYSATIIWGDGQSTGGTVSADGNGGWNVTGSHTYASHDSFSVSVSIGTNQGASTSANSTSIVSPSMPAVTGGFTLSSIAGTDPGSQTVATFTDSGQSDPASDYSALISYGDSSSSDAGTITYAGGTFIVTGDHAYAAAGSYTISVTVSHAGLSAATVYGTASVTGAQVAPIPPLPTPASGEIEDSDLVYTLSNGFVVDPSNTFSPVTLTNETLNNTTATTVSNTSQDSSSYPESVTVVTTPSLHIAETLGPSGTWTYVESLSVTVDTWTMPVSVFGTTELDDVTYGYTFSASQSTSGQSSFSFTSSESYDDSGAANWPGNVGNESSSWSQIGTHTTSITSSGNNNQSGNDWKTASVTEPFESITSGFTFSGSLTNGTTETDFYTFSNSSGTEFDAGSTSSSYRGAGPYVDDSSDASITGNASEQGSDNSQSTSTLVESWSTASDQWVVTGRSGFSNESISDSSSYNGSGPDQWTDASGVSYTGFETVQGSDSDSKVYSWILGLGGDGVFATTGGTGVISDTSSQQGNYDGTGSSVNQTDIAVLNVTQSDIGENSNDTTFVIGETWNPFTGQWTPNTGSGTSNQTILNITNYNGNGPADWTDTQGNTYTGSSSEQGNDTNLSDYSSVLTLNPATGQLQTSSGAGLTTDDRTDSSSYQGSGTYIDNEGGGSVAGSESESGSDNSNSDSTLVESWNTAGQKWVGTSANGSDVETVQNSSNYQGSGTYATTDTLHNVYSGSASESGSDSNVANYSSDYGLDSNGNLAVVSGTGTIADISNDSYQDSDNASAWVDTSGNHITGTYKGSTSDNSDSNSTLNEAWSAGQWVPSSASGISHESIHNASNYTGSAHNTVNDTLSNAFSGTINENGNDTNDSYYTSNLGLVAGVVGVVSGSAANTDVTTGHSDYSNSATAWTDSSGDHLTGTISHQGSDDNNANTTYDQTYDATRQSWVGSSATGVGHESITDSNTYSGTGSLSYTTAGSNYTGNVTESGSETSISSSTDNYGLGSSNQIAVISGAQTASDVEQGLTTETASATYNDNNTVSFISGTEWVTGSDSTSNSSTVHQTLDTVHSVWVNSGVNGSASENITNSSHYSGSGLTDYVDSSGLEYLGPASESGNDKMTANYTSAPQLDSSSNEIWTGTGSSNDDSTGTYSYTGDDESEDADPSISGNDGKDGHSSINYTLSGNSWVATSGTNSSNETLSNQFNDDDDVSQTSWVDSSNHTFTGTVTLNDDSTIATISHESQTLSAGTWVTSGGNVTQNQNYNDNSQLNGTCSPYVFTDSSGDTLSGELTDSVLIASVGHNSIVETYNTTSSSWLPSSGGGTAQTTTTSNAGYDGSAPDTWVVSTGLTLTGSMTETVGDIQSTIAVSNLTLGPDGQLHPDSNATQNYNDDQYGTSGLTGSATYTFIDGAGDTLTGSITESGGVKNDVSTTLAETWNGSSTWTVNSFSKTKNQTITSKVHYSGDGPSTWTDIEGDALTGTATDTVDDQQTTAYHRNFGTNSNPTGSATDTNSAVYTYMGNGVVYDDMGNAIGSVNESGSISTAGSSNVSLSYSGEEWQMASGSGSDGEMDSTTKTRIVNNTGSDWIDVEGQTLTGTTGDTQSEINNNDYEWDLTVTGGNLQANTGTATLNGQTVDTISDSGNCEYSPLSGVNGSETATRTSITSVNSTAIESYDYGTWAGTGGDASTDVSTNETDSYDGSGLYNNIASSSNSYHFAVTAESDISTDSTLNDDGSWSTVGGGGYSNFDGEINENYNYVSLYTAGDLNDPDPTVIYSPSTYGTLIASGSDNTSFNLDGTASVGDDGSITWSGTGDASETKADNANYNGTLTTTVVDSGSWLVENITNVSEVSSSSTDTSTISTDYTLSPSGQWLASSSNANNSAEESGNQTGIADSYVDDIGGNNTFIITSTTGTANESYDYSYSGHLHASWDANGNQTVSGSSAGGGFANGSASVHEDNSDWTGYHSIGDITQVYSYQESWTQGYDPDSTAAFSASGEVSTDGESTVNGELYSDTESDPITEPPPPLISDGANPLGGPDDYAFGYEDSEPSTSPAAAGQASIAPVPTASAADAENFANNDSPNVIAPAVNVEITTPTPNVNNGAPATSNGGFTFSDSQLNASWLGNFTNELFVPSSYGTAASSVTTPTWMKYTQTGGLIGLGIVTGGLAAEGAAAYMGAEAAATWGGTLLTGAIGGATGSLFQNAATQAFSDQPFSYTQLAEQTVAGGILGAAAGGVIKGVVAAFPAIGDLASSAIQNILGSEGSEVAGQVADEAGNLSCFCAGTKVLTPTGLADIEQIQIGRRILPYPGDEIGPRIDPASHCVIRITFVKVGQEFHLSFLRPAALFKHTNIGDFIDLSVMELEVEGPARVLAIEPCPPIEEGIGHVVTGTFTSQSIDVRLLKLQGLGAPIEVTGNHPIFSEDRRDFVKACELREGERLRSRDGIAVVEQLGRKFGKWDVFNLEIAGAHQYYVTERSVLVHNANGLLPPGGGSWKDYLTRLIGDAPEGMPNPHAHHILFKVGNGEEQQQLVAEGQAILRRAKLNPISGVENLVWAPLYAAGQHSIEALTNVVVTLRAVEDAGGSQADFVKALAILGKIAAARR